VSYTFVLLHCGLLLFVHLSIFHLIHALYLISLFVYIDEHQLLPNLKLSRILQNSNWKESNFKTYLPSFHVCIYSIISHISWNVKIKKENNCTNYKASSAALPQHFEYHPIYSFLFVFSHFHFPSFWYI